MSVEVDVQYAINADGLPSVSEIETWVNATVRGHRENVQMTVRIVDEKEGTELNERWRRSQGPTNVLSFPCEDLEGIAADLLGDVIICAPVVEREAQEQGKSVMAHWTHLVIHGTLHLLGYDHIDEDRAREMEALETRILDALGYPDPYGSVTES
ncbi:MAG: rRNA maturation RNase YbeY [Gammaproteobacteria bacterium]|nr:rRNA maturation RNase YbeY [Gammaproteobacteria bacterium]MCI0591552.1 rRNA maturation RNase YbeY [Gammaproteobacteria bacterium]